MDSKKSEIRWIFNGFVFFSRRVYYLVMLSTSHTMNYIQLCFFLYKDMHAYCRLQNNGQWDKDAHLLEQFRILFSLV